MFESALSSLLKRNSQIIEAVLGVNITQVNLYSGRRLQQVGPSPSLSSVSGLLVSPTEDQEVDLGGHIVKRSDQVNFESKAEQRALASTISLEVGFSVVLVSSVTSPTELAQGIRLVMKDMFNYSYSSTITPFDQQLVETKAALSIPLSSWFYFLFFLLFRAKCLHCLILFFSHQQSTLMFRPP